ncbi:MAG: PfkB family carbohydrate kinase, partial [Gammaproteobacteria bacterium]
CHRAGCACGARLGDRPDTRAAWTAAGGRLHDRGRPRRVSKPRSRGRRPVEPRATIPRVMDGGSPLESTARERAMPTRRGPSCGVDHLVVIQHASQFVEADIPFVFDPGQGLPMFDADELKNFFNQATWVTVNDYEWQMMQERTEMTPHNIAELVDALIITKGGDGSLIYTKEKRYEIPSARPESLEDPTGCGDAYRAGLLYGLMNDMDWETTGRIASLMGAIKIENHGTQNHSFIMDEFKARFIEEFDREM